MNGLFSPYAITIAAGARAALERTGQTADEFIERHVSGDFGDLGAADAHENHLAIDHRETIYSVYVLNDKRTLIWVTTELSDDGKWTLVCLPSEYSDGLEGL